jgi:predicted transposase YbfD/YdcC
MLNAWSSENHLVLGQLAVNEKSNEITAVPQLMDMLDLECCIITADALNCRRNIAAKILSKKADYFLAFKGDHPSLYEDSKLYMDDISNKEKPVKRVPGKLSMKAKRFQAALNVEFLLQALKI